MWISRKEYEKMEKQINALQGSVWSQRAKIENHCCITQTCLGQRCKHNNLTLQSVMHSNYEIELKEELNKYRKLHDFNQNTITALTEKNDQLIKELLWYKKFYKHTF